MLLSGTDSKTLSSSFRCGELVGDTTFQYTVSVNTVPGVEAIQVYPNPSTGLVTLDYGTAQPELVQLFSSTGQLCGQWSLSDFNPVGKPSFDLGHLPEGLYHMLLHFPGGSRHRIGVVKR